MESSTAQPQTSAASSPKHPSTSRPSIPPLTPAEADRIIAEAAATTRALQKAREPAKMLDGALTDDAIADAAGPDGIITVGAKDYTKRQRLNGLASDGQLVKVGDFQFRQPTPEERAKREQENTKRAEQKRVDDERQAEQRRAADEWREEQQRKELKRARLSYAQFLWESSGIGARYVHADLQHIGDAPAAYAAAAAELVKTVETPKLIALIGNRGVGKTELACGLVREFCRHGRRGQYLRTLELFRMIRSTWGRGRGEATEADVLEKLRCADVLVLDEFHVQSGTEWERNIIVDLIDARYSALRATVLVANLQSIALTAAMGESIASRFQEAGLVIECDWPSFRRERSARHAEAPKYDATGERFAFPPVSPGARPTPLIGGRFRDDGFEDY